MTSTHNSINLNRVFKAHLTGIETVAVGVKKFTFLPDHPFSFLPWQYVWLEIPDLQFPDLHGSRRAFSVFNTQNSDNTLEIVSRLTDSGYKQSLFNLSKGAEVIIHGPFGSSFMVDEKSDKNIFMIAGGVGIATFISLIQTIKSFPHPQKCFLIYQNKSPEVTPFLALLDNLKKENSFFDYRVSYGHFVWEDISPKYSEMGPDSRWMIVGPQAMINDVSGKLEIAGVPKSQMEFENYYPSPTNNLTRANIEEQLSAHNLFAAALQYSTNHSIITDTNGVVLFANQAAQKITGYSEAEILGNTPRLWGGMMDREYYINFWKNITSGINFTQEIVNRRKNGQIYFSLAHISSILGSDGTVIGYIGTEEDITVHVESEKRLADKVGELERLNKVMVGRELKMIELKEEIKKLKGNQEKNNS